MKRQTWVRCLLILLAVSLFAGASRMGALQAADNQKEIEKHAEIYFKKMENVNVDDPDALNVIFTAMRELIAMGPDVVDYAITKLAKLDNVSGIGAAFVLGHIEDPKIAATLFNVLKQSKFKGDDDERASGTSGSMGEMTRNLRDGFVILSLSMQASRMDRDDPESLKLYTQIVEQLRSYLNPENDRRSFVRMCAVMGLGFYLFDNESVGNFCKFAKDEKSVAILRVAASLALANFNTEEARTTLEEIARKMPVNDHWKMIYLQKNAALALGNNGDKDSIPVLMDIIKENKFSVGARNFAWASLGELFGLLEDPEEIKKMNEFFNEQLEKERDLKVRTTAAYTIYRYGQVGKALDMLETILWDSKSPLGRLVYASQILGMMLDERSKELLLKCLTHNNIGVQRVAVANLVKWSSDPEIAKRLLHIAANEKDSVMRQQATLALLKMEKTEDNLKIISKVAKGDEPMKRVAALALTNCSPDKEILKILAQLMREQDPLVADYATCAFGSTADETPVNLALLKSLIDMSPYYMVRRDADKATTCLKEKNTKAVQTQIAEFLERESLVPTQVWRGLFTEQVNLILQASVMETKAKGDIEVDSENETAIEEDDDGVTGNCAG